MRDAGCSEGVAEGREPETRAVPSRREPENAVVREGDHVVVLSARTPGPALESTPDRSWSRGGGGFVERVSLGGGAPRARGRPTMPRNGDPAAATRLLLFTPLLVEPNASAGPTPRVDVVAEDG